MTGFRVIKVFGGWKNEFKWREKLLLPQTFIVSLHQQSKEKPYVPENGYL